MAAGDLTQKHGETISKKSPTVGPIEWTLKPGYLIAVVSQLGCFQHWVFHYKPSIFGYPYFWKHPLLNGVDLGIGPIQFVMETIGLIFFKTNPGVSYSEDGLPGRTDTWLIIMSYEAILMSWLMKKSFYNWVVFHPLQQKNKGFGHCSNGD